MISSEIDFADPSRMDRVFADRFCLTVQPVRYVYDTEVAFCSREPWRSSAREARPGQPASLSYRPDQRTLAVMTGPETAIGSLYAADAAFLSILCDFTDIGRSTSSPKQTPERTDHSLIRTVLTGPQPDRPETRRKRYPKVALRICLDLQHAWPLFTILTVLHLKDEVLPPCACLDNNPWLQPFECLRQEYRTRQYDQFSLPNLLAETWISLTGGA